MNDDIEPRFIVDEMFGNLARWLRLLGFDTIFASEFKKDNTKNFDSIILRFAITRDRILITGDKQLYIRALRLGVKAIYIDPKLDVKTALDKILNTLHAHTFVKTYKFTRCPKCNGYLQKVDKEKIKTKVPARVYQLYNEFWICTSCGKVYWTGSHFRTIKTVLNEILAEQNGN